MNISQLFNEGWQFRRHPHGDFHSVTLPHDAMLGQGRCADAASGYNQGYFLGGTYTYRKEWHAPLATEYETLSLLFHGIQHRSKILVNGVVAGGRRNGYVAFEVPVESFVKAGAKNLIEVIADTSSMPTARYYTGAGLYRHVELISRHKISLERDGVRLHTTSITNGTAHVAVVVHLRNPFEQPAATSVTFSYQGRQAALWQMTTTGTKVEGTIDVPDAHLWSVDDPSLYECTVSVNEDCAKFRTGLRTLDWNAQQGFRINGVETLLRGACIHQDHGIIGAAMFRDAEIRRIKIMKQSGFNAIRVAHNPSSKTLLEVCDEVGMYVMDEFSDTWYNTKATGDNSAKFLEDWEIDVEALHANNRLHPCVIMNALCNEPTEPSSNFGRNLAKRILTKSKTLDPTRPTTMGVNLMIAASWPVEPKDDGVTPPKPMSLSIDSALINVLFNSGTFFLKWVPWLSRVDYATRGLYGNMDIAGYNYGVIRYDKDTRLHPDRIMVGTETVPDDLPEIWEKVCRIPNLIGDFMWTGWDYLGETGIGAPEYDVPWYQFGRFFKPYPAISGGCGAIDLIGNATAVMYVAQAVWGLRQEPVIMVRPLNLSHLSHRATSWRRSDAISSWSWQGCEGRTANIEVVSPHEEIELVQNGRSLGRRAGGRTRNFTAHFSSTYDAGEVTALAYTGGKLVSQSTLKAAGPASLKAYPETPGLLVADNQTLLFVSIELSDSDGIVEMVDDDMVTVNVEGPASLIGFGNSAVFTEEAFDDNVHSTHLGRALAVIRAGAVPGHVQIAVKSERHGSIIIDVHQTVPT